MNMLPQQATNAVDPGGSVSLPPAGLCEER